MTYQHEESAVALARLNAHLATGRARLIRRQAGLSQADVARSIGGSASAVAAWENRQRRPRGELAMRYGSLLNALADMVGIESGRGDDAAAGAAR